MIFAILYLLALSLSSSLASRGKPRSWLAMCLPLFIIDCALNAVVTRGSFRNTLSAQAWFHRDHKYWKHAHRVIDAGFFWQANHCRDAAEKEALHGSFWAAWFHDFKRG